MGEKSIGDEGWDRIGREKKDIKDNTYIKGKLEDRFQYEHKQN